MVVKGFFENLKIWVWLHGRGNFYFGGRKYGAREWVWFLGGGVFFLDIWGGCFWIEVTEHPCPEDG